MYITIIDYLNRYCILVKLLFFLLANTYSDKVVDPIVSHLNQQLFSHFTSHFKRHTQQ